MFTGIVEERGEVVHLDRLGDSGQLTVRGSIVTDDLRPGDSVAVNGCCLTVIARSDGGDAFTADVMAETLTRTTLGSLQPGHAVNLERPVRADGRLGGHLVQGHVDGSGLVRTRQSTPRWDLVEIELSAELARYVAEKGSIAVDGVSLTVAGVRDLPYPACTVALIPTTLARTTLGLVAPGDAVNLEVDVLAKYVHRLTAAALPTRPGERHESPSSEGAKA